MHSSNQNSALQQTIDEFDLIRDGDKILVCMSGSSSSMCLIHLLRQFSRARGLHVELAALTLNSTGVDPRALMLYMRDLGIEFIYEFDRELSTICLKDKLAVIARKKGFNVIALGNTLDKLADHFLSSVICRGKLDVNSPCIKNR